MVQMSRELRQAVHQAILCAKSAAKIQQLISDFGPASDGVFREEIKMASQAAYAASAHAWIAMLAMASNSVDVAQNAAQAACDAERIIVAFAESTLLLDLNIGQDHELAYSLPNEQELYHLWDEFCRSLPSGFPVPDSFDERL